MTVHGSLAYDGAYPCHGVLSALGNTIMLTVSVEQ